jgi:hypothetical protein
MAALTYTATRIVTGANVGRGMHTVVASTDDSIGSAPAAVILDNTKTKAEVMEAFNAIRRRISRDFNKTDRVSAVATSGDTLE